MLKGVNKLIIEVNNPESDFFERAIFFVKPGKSGIVTGEMTSSVHDIMGRAGNIKARGMKHAKSRALLKFAGAAAIGAGISAILINLL